MQREDLDWRRGRHSVYVWHADEELEMVLRQAYSLFLTENGLGLRAFPSLRRMEEETLAMVRALLSMRETPEPADAADALAVALCHLQAEQARRRFGLPDGNELVRPRTFGAAAGAPVITTGIRMSGATRNKLPRILSTR